MFAYVCAQLLRGVLLFATPWTIACQAPLSMGFFRQGNWSGLPFLPPGDLPDPGTEPMIPASPTLAGGLSTTEPPGKPCIYKQIYGQQRLLLNVGFLDLGWRFVTKEGLSLFILYWFLFLELFFWQ